MTPIKNLLTIVYNFYEFLFYFLSLDRGHNLLGDQGIYFLKYEEKNKIKTT